MKFQSIDIAICQCPGSTPGTGHKSGATDGTRTKIVPVHPKTLQRKNKNRGIKIIAKRYGLTHKRKKSVGGKAVAWLPP